jgi:hypothetical protein
MINYFHAIVSLSFKNPELSFQYSQTEKRRPPRRATINEGASLFVTGGGLDISGKANPNPWRPQGNFLILIPNGIQVVSW